MDDDRLDLSALDPTRDAEELDRRVGVILARVAPSLAVRRLRPTLWEPLGRLRRPVLSLAAAIAVTSVVVLARVPAPSARRAEATAAAASRAASAAAATRAAASGESQTLMESAGVPASVAHWVDRGESPSAAALLDL
jgi:hypothetical protein